MTVVFEQGSMSADLKCAVCGAEGFRLTDGRCDGCWMTWIRALGRKLAMISRWIDESHGYIGIDPEAHNWRRLMKVVSEAGEVYDAYGAVLGENPRKPEATGTMADVIGEALDCAVSALGSVEHVTGNLGLSFSLLVQKVDKTCDRVGLVDKWSPEADREWAVQRCTDGGPCHYRSDECTLGGCMRAPDQQNPDTTPVQVGWYCPGGHLNDKGETVGPSIRLDDPCAHGVPVFAHLQDSVA